MTDKRRSDTVADDPDSSARTQDASVWLNEHGDVLYRYARSRVRHREVAEDLVQEVLLAAIQSRDRFQGHSTVRTWLLSILRNKVADHYRNAAKSVVPIEFDSIDAKEPVRSRYFTAKGLWKTALSAWKAPNHALENREFWIVVDDCLRRLPRSLASAFSLREVESRDTAEVRQILNLSEANLRVRLHRARLLLRECLERHWFAETREGTGRTP